MAFQPKLILIFLASFILVYLLSRVSFNCLDKTKELYKKNKFNLTPALKYFFDNDINEHSFENEEIKKSIPEKFASLDDSDIIVSLKHWAKNEDVVLSELSRRLINRDLFKIEISNSPFSEERIKEFKNNVLKRYKIDEQDLEYFVFSDKIKNKAYSTDNDIQINILLKSGKLSDIAEASDLSNISALSYTVEKYFLCYPREILI